MSGNQSFARSMFALRYLVLMLLAIALACSTFAAPAERGMANGMAIGKMTDQPDSWFQSDQGKTTVQNIITWQNPNGGWWKTYDATAPRPPAVANRAGSGPKGDDDSVWHQVSTIDNNATYSEMRILARASRVNKDEKAQESFEKGMKFLFDSQYPNGGWPQRFPLQENYGRHITYNDDAMLGVMRLLQDVVSGKPDFAFVSTEQRGQAKQAFDRGIECVLNCQIKSQGKLTVWCQQHDEKTLVPANARAYELPSLSGSESAGLLILLMDLEKPDARIRNAIESGVAWYQESKITGKKVQRVTGPQYENGKDTIVTADPNAKPIWARFYDIETGKPYFCGRDGIKRESLDQIPQERRAGYAWYGEWGDKVLDAYPKWKQRVGQ